MVLKIIFYFNLADKTQNYEDYQTGGKCNMDCKSFKDCDPGKSGCISCGRVQDTTSLVSSLCLRSQDGECVQRCQPQLKKSCTLHEKECITDYDCERTPSSNPRHVPITRESCTKCTCPVHRPTNVGCIRGTLGCEGRICKCREP